MRKRTALLLIAVGLALSSCAREKPAVQEQAAEPAAASGVSPHLLALLPANNEVAGWSMTQKPRSFRAGDLYEYIDGAADGFIAYGFQEVANADYKQAGSGYETVVDIYEMKDPLNAFGKYAEERNPSYPFLKIGNEGYSGGTAVNFWSGPYYVKIAAFDENDAVRQEMVKLAQAVAAKVKNPGGEPSALLWFPKANQLPHTALYIPKDVLAQSYLGNGFEIKYKTGGKEYKILLINMETSDAARDALARYRRFVATAGKDVKDIRSPADGGFSGKDSFYGSMAAARSGSRIAVVLGAPSLESGIEAISELLANAR